jgi:hypothetical protein
MNPKIEPEEHEEEVVAPHKPGVMGIKFTLKDLITIFTFLATIVTAYTNVSERIIRVEQQILSYTEYTTDVREKVKELRTEIEQYKRDDVRRVTELEQTLFYLQQQVHRNHQTK